MNKSATTENGSVVVKVNSISPYQMNRRKFLKITGIAAGTLALGGVTGELLNRATAVPPAPVTIDPRTILKYVNQLPIPGVYTPSNVYDPLTGNLIRQDYTIGMLPGSQDVLGIKDALGNPVYMTNVWGYGGTYPGATFEATRGIPVRVKWINDIPAATPHPFAVDPTLHWANPNNMAMPVAPFLPFPPGYPDAQKPVPLTAHLHGSEVPSASDGHPNSWFTQDGKHGMAYNSLVPTDQNAAVFEYPNSQLPTTLWYHDHSLGITRLNVMTGLAGFYLLRDPNDTIAPNLPGGQYEIPIVIQDRILDLNGQFFFPSLGINPNIHPYWIPEFFGDTIVVNGKAWPNLSVDNGQYRFRLLNGSNARFYTLKFSNKMPFIQIGAEGGYLKSAVTLTELTIAPGERADILVDFRGLAAGTKLILENSARAPFPKGVPPNPQTVGQIMQFTVTGNPGFIPPANQLPAILNPIPALTPDRPDRILTLVEVMGPAGPLEVLLDGQKWHMDVSEKPKEGTTEDWVVVNLTADTHPIHLHLIQFQLITRQEFQVKKYMTDWIVLNGGMMPPFMSPTVPLNPIPYLQNKSRRPDLNEIGWKDTVRMNTGEVTRIRVRFARQDYDPAVHGTAYFPFDSTVGPGYVWHCHIIDHEDNEMMRPYKVTN